MREFYPSITEDILITSLSFANKYENKPNKPKADTRKINHCRKPLLFSNNQPWKKEDAEGCFDRTMGSPTGKKFVNSLESTFCHTCQPL